MKYQKIYILGTAGSGKTTLASKLSEVLNIPYYDLDDIYWVKKYTIKRNKAKRKEKLKQLIKEKKEWILEGIYTDWSETAIKKADLIVWIDTPKHIISWRIFKRYFKRRGEKKEIFKDCINLIKYARTYKKAKGSTGYKAHKDAIKKYKSNFIVLKNNKQINQLINNILK